MPSKLTLDRRVFIKGISGGAVGIMSGCWINLSAANSLDPADSGNHVVERSCR